MDKALGLASILVVLVGAGVAPHAGANPMACLAVTCSPPRLLFHLGATVVPRKLPRNEPSPAGFELQGTIRPSPGSHPSALRELVLDIDKDVVIDATGLPTCKGSLLRARNVRGARNACRDSIVGNGTAEIAIVSAPEPIPTILTLFNGGVRDGKRFLYIHSFIATPTREAIVTSVEISRKGSGLHTVSRIPPIADGSGSLVDFSFTIKRLFIHRDANESYLEARCPDSIFKVNVPKALFRNEAEVTGVAASTVLKGGVTVPCTPSAG